MSAAHIDPLVRHDMVFLFDVTLGNPNGDPDNANQPRVDEETGCGLVTDVALKRKIRDTLALAGENDERYGIFVEAGHALNTRLEQSYTANGFELGNKKKISREEIAQARSWLCDRYADIRLFGAVLSLGRTTELGQIRGPFQLTMARSMDPVFPVDHTITRVTQTKQEDIDKGETTEIGGKWAVPYGLYKAEIYYSANRGQQTGVDARDFELLYRSLEMMFDHDRSANRGQLSPRGLYVFSHSNSFGSAPAHKLTERVSIERVDSNDDRPARSFGDYVVSVNDDELPEGVQLTKLIG